MAKRKTKRGLGDISALRCIPGTVTLRREPVSRDGYASGGRYFGTGEKLWSFTNGDGHDYSSGYLRAKDKATAKKMILAKCPRTTGFAGAKKRRK